MDTHGPDHAGQEHEAAAARALRDTRDWLVHAVIGLDLCPFARAPFAKGRIRFVVSDATSPQALLATLADELARLAATSETEIETTLLIHPWVLDDFLAFNDFLADGDALIVDARLDGVIQLASFHPRYQFADTEVDDVSNATNRSPHPTLHLLRESSVERAVDAHPDTDAIYAANIARLEALGADGWSRLQQRWQRTDDAA